ncbi:MAG: Uma2 family endonuclease [Bryobacteraceae bacterium]
MATISGLMTVEQFWQLPEGEPFQYELHHGELVKVSRPKLRHIRIQYRLQKLLERIFGPQQIVVVELPFRALPEFELRAADVAVLARERWEQADDDDVVHGAPEIVIEVLSRSNTVSEIAEYCALCLENGSREFWTVDSNRREIKVSTPDGLTRTYKSGDSIPLTLAGDQTLAVDAVFAIE